MPAFLQNVRKAIAALNPGEIREAAARDVRILVAAGNSAGYAALEDFLLPASVSSERRWIGLTSLVRASDPKPGSSFDLFFYEDTLPVPADWVPGEDAFRFDPLHLETLPAQVLEHKDEFGLALARRFPPFRHAAAKKIIHTVSRENAMFSLMTALPNVVPNIAQLPWAAGEFASDTAVLTANQIRMAFFLAAASGRTPGFREQRNEIGSLVAGAWGWRAAARQLTGKIPFGGGLIPKAAIAYAGTYVVGLSLERLYRMGAGLSAAERERAFSLAKEKGKEDVRGLLARR